MKQPTTVTTSHALNDIHNALHHIADIKRNVQVVPIHKGQADFAPFPKTSHLPIKPLYMWAGGKTKLLKHYQNKMPSYEGFAAYIEPFFGGGAVFCDVVNSKEIEHFAINDINPELFSIYQAIKTEPEAFIEKCVALAEEWNAKTPPQRWTWYYALRRKYWNMKAGELATTATLYVLMKTCFNGVWQPSARNAGKFGTAVGLRKKEAKIDPDLIRAWSAKLQNTTITSQSYREIGIPATPCLIYCDPPYRGSFTSYGQDFDDQAQKELVDWCQSMAAKGHTVILANRDCNDGFFKAILGDEVTVHYFDVTYTVGRKKKTKDGHEAKKAVEFIAIFEGKEIKAANDDDFCEVPVNLDDPKIAAEYPSSGMERDIRSVPLPIPIRRSARRQRRGSLPTRPCHITEPNTPENQAKKYNSRR